MFDIPATAGGEGKVDEKLLNNGKIDSPELALFESLEPELGGIEPSPKARKEEKEAYLGKEIKRVNRLKEVVSYVVNIGLAVLASIFVLMALARSWHLIGPEELLWMTKEQMSQVDHLILVITTGTVATFASSYFKVIFGFEKNVGQSYPG